MCWSSSLRSGVDCYRQCSSRSSGTGWPSWCGTTKKLPALRSTYTQWREDYEYLIAGTRNLFLTCEPRRGWRHIAITEQRTVQDFAHRVRWLVDEAHPDVPVVRLVLDNLNTHRMASLHEPFPAAEAIAVPFGGLAARETVISAFVISAFSGIQGP